MKFIADLHIHSKYSRATSRNMDVLTLVEWSKFKGIKLLGTGDFTHHLWLEELKKNLQPLDKEGLFISGDTYFILSAEVSNIFSQSGRGYRVHNMIMVPTFKIAKEITHMLSFYGNVSSDGRPIVGISCQRLAEELFKISPEIMLVPAHIWTPWFSVFGSNSGFNSLDEAFGKYTDKITALETGLSSDPGMNWRCSQLDKFTLISNSDAHSPAKIGREANVFDCQLNYWEIKKVLESKDRDKFLYTIEFFPEEGKYHYDGHRNCGIRLSPQETKKVAGICPKCGRPLTKGVLYRVDELSDRAEGVVPANAIPFKSLVPLEEIIADVRGQKRGTKAVTQQYQSILYKFGAELEALIEAPEKDLFSNMPEDIAWGIINVRNGKVNKIPGFDGEYGSIKVLPPEESGQSKEEQLSLF